MAVQTEQLEQKTAEDEDAPNAEYYAQLAGFGTARAAQQFAQKLAKKEIAVVVKKDKADQHGLNLYLGIK